MTALYSTESYTIGWIAALPMERAAATALLDDRHQPPTAFEQHPSDTNSYTWGRMGNHNIVIASLPAGVYGTTAAGTTASNLLGSLPQIRIGLLVGIGGGIARHLDQDVRLGDVVVSQPDGTAGGVVQYDLGKARLNGEWEPKGKLNKPPQVLLSALAALQAEHEMTRSKIPDLLEVMWTKMPQMKKLKRKGFGYIHQGFENDRLFSSVYDHVDGHTCEQCDPSKEIQRDIRDTTDPEIHYGIIASGNTLVKDASTRDKIAESAGSECICVEMEAAGLMDHFPCLVIRGICDYADSHKNDRWHRYASATAAAYAKELLEYVPTKMLQDTARVVDILKSVSKDIKSIQSAATKVQEEIQGLYEMVLNVDQKMVLSRLPIAKGASFDSSAEEHNPTCLPSTRVELLHEIQNWADDLSNESIFWLNGMAGTGKSTISRTAARSFAVQGRLGASFFFKRGETDRGTIAKFFTTIAADLVHRKPATALYVKNALDADTLVVTRSTREQFNQLFLNPLSKIGNVTKEAPIVIVVDALDECEQECDIRLVIQLFFRVKIALPIPIKIFLTSRPELPLRLEFAIQGTYQDVILHEIPQPLIERDISVYFEHRLTEIRMNFNASVTENRHLYPTWPSQSDIRSLVKMSVPLFIFAATVCLFIADRKYGNPGKQLAKVLSHRAKNQQANLSDTYLLILRQQIAGFDEEEENDILQEFREIVGPIIILGSPLSTTALSQLLRRSQRTIDDRLDLLHSVLSVPESSGAPVRLLHLSFREFLVDPDRREQNPFWIDETHTHAVIAAHCLRVLGCLKQDICDLKSPGASHSDISADRIDACLPPEVQYACLYWVHHLEKADIRISDGIDVYPFLIQHFLHWMEALALIGRASESLGFLRRLQSRLEDQNSMEISLFLQDATRFVQAYVSVISSTPLQLYSSLLIFTPKGSIVRTTFEDSEDKARWISLEPWVENNWSQCLQTLEGHCEWVKAVTFSHDSALVMSASVDKTVQIWRADTGEYVQTLEGHSDGVQSVAFSHNSSLVASASRDTTVWIWRADTGECVQILEGHSDWVQSVAFSHNSALVVSASYDKTVRIWGADNAECVQVLEGHSDVVQSVAFSHDSALVASASIDKTVRIWRADTGKCIQTLDGHSNWVESVAFSNDSTLIASASDDKTVRIWYTNTGECIQILEGHSDFVQSVAFSHNSALVASASRDKTVRIWRIGTSKCVQTLEGHSDWVQSVAFSHNSTLVASASKDKTVRIWQANAKECVQMLEGHSDAVQLVTFSHDLALVTSASNDKTVRIWRADTGECVQTLEGHSDWVQSVVFSHNSALVASASRDKMVRIWRTHTGECLQTLGGHSSFILSVVFSHDSSLVASASCDNAVRIWRTDTGECLQTLDGHSNWVESVAFSNDSALVASASDDKTVRIWRADTGECIQTLEGHGAFVLSVVFSHNSALVASASRDRTVRIWRVDTGECMQTLEGHSDFVQSVAFSHDSALVASASADKTVRVWRAGTGECLQTVNIVCTSWRLSFDRSNSHLLTDVGMFANVCGGVVEMGMSAEYSGIGISEDGCWITWNGKRFVWLPVEFRPICSAVSESTVVIGSNSGRVAIIRLSPDSPTCLRWVQ